MENFANGPEMPIGFGMVLAQDVHAMDYFAALPDEDKQQVINKAQSIHSKDEMHSFVNSLGGNQGMR